VGDVGPIRGLVVWVAKKVRNGKFVCIYIVFVFLRY